MNEISYEMEILGNRIDAVKNARTQATSDWSKKYLETLEITLVKRWKEFVLKHDVGFFSNCVVKNEGKTIRTYYK